MGLRYQKRVNLGDGVGFNLSKSGVSSSYRTKYGSIGSKGFSIRTGIPGLAFRKSSGRSKNDLAVTIITFILIGALFVGVFVIWNIARFLWWGSKEIVNASRRYLLKRKIVKEENAWRK